MTGRKAGPVEVIVASMAEIGGANDDFALDARGNAWVTSGAENAVYKVDVASGKAELVVGGSKQGKLVGPAVAKFGRARGQKGSTTLYVVDNGGIAVPPPQGVAGGALFAFDAGLV
jgi:hypothetical protein